MASAKQLPSGSWRVQLYVGKDPTSCTKETGPKRDRFFLYFLQLTEPQCF